MLRMCNSSSLYDSKTLFKLTVKSLSLLELTLFTIVLTAVVAIILAFCKTFLIKPKSSRHAESKLTKEKTPSKLKETKKTEKSGKI